MSKNKHYLFSIDLEDVRRDVKDGHQYRDAVVSNTLIYLEWLRKYKMHCTFFTVGEIAEQYPDLVKEIVQQGHEIASHSMHHIPLDKLGKEAFKKDIVQNKEALLKAGAHEVKGFRAPVFSLTQKTSWAYSVLAENDFTYSSSVLPAQNPLYGWADFGKVNKKVDGILEMPVTLASFGPKTVPFGGGVYFRVLPWFFTKKAFQKSDTIIGYFHPYDLDVHQETFMHAGINNSSFFNALMYRNRNKVIDRLDKLMADNWKIITYEEYLKTIEHV
jgi:polysaccharide deacetylase family protein (PEP-CTERM system associated)